MSHSTRTGITINTYQVDPIELVVWLPALCRKMNVPYCIVKGKARLGAMVYKKTATALALTEVNKEDLNKLEQCVASYKLMYLDSAVDRRKWGGGIMGFKAQQTLKKREKALTQAANKAALSVI